MNSSIISLSERGQLTIPQSIRDKIHVKYFVCKVSDNQIILEPLQTRDEFFEELDAAEKDWGKNGGLTLQAIKKKYKL